jgi:hypothetical protein
LPTHIRGFIPPVKHIKHFLRLTVAGTAALGVLVGAFYLIGDWMSEWATSARDIDPSRWNVVIWAPPLVVIAFWLSATSFVGLAGHALRELDRELLARYLAIIIKWSVASTALLLIAVYSYPLLLAAGERGAELNLTLGAAWAAASAIGAWLARSAQTSGGPWISRLKKTVLMLAPYIFSVGLLLISVWVVHALLDGLLDWEVGWLQALRPHELGYVQLNERYWDRMGHGYWRLLLPAGIIVFILTLLWSWRIGVNTFSLHALYGDRLVRAYLGASNIDRSAHPFHGFDEADNAVRMQDLVADRYSGPLLIVNTAVNLVSSRRLAWQKRKAASFTFTPLFAGYEFYGDNDITADRSGGYIRSTIYGGSKGASLGKAMTISGAAASPNMGYHSTPGLTFLMTTFNVRLGWWLPNTGRHRKRSLAWLWGDWPKRLSREHISRSDPPLGLLYLINELLGRTGTQSDYIYLSDGGHFENLGIYELVRRRCRFIIACDAEADPHMRFAGLGNAIEKCRTDLGIPIHIDVSQLRPDPKTGLSRWHCALGCIGYSEADPGEADGTILYIKASRTGGEPQDVQTYADQYSAFPHESTADQWFDETQFESYRALGEHSAHRVLSTAVRVAKQAWSEDRQRFPGIPERTFLELRKQWYPHAADTDSKPADHDALLEAILDTVREDKRLVFLDAQLYPDIHRVATSEPSGKCAPAGDKPWLPQNYEQLRAGFYFCKRLIQFMQQVYHDCRLDTEYYAPSNRGWMNLFRRWSWSRMFRFTWAMTAGTYSARFQSFCEHQLDLETGEPRFPERALPVRAHYAKAENRIEVEVLDARTKNVIDWSEAEKTSGIDYYEHRLIEEFVRTYARCKPTETGSSSLDFDVYALKVDTESPLTDEPDNQAELNAGILIVGPDIRAASGKKAILYFRIRSAMRNMDLARKAFLKLNQHHDLRKYKVEIFEDKSAVEEHLKTPWQKRAFREIHMMKRESLDRCRWFSQLLEDIEEKDARKPSELPTAAPCAPVGGTNVMNHPCGKTTHPF